MKLDEARRLLVARVDVPEPEPVVPEYPGFTLVMQGDIHISQDAPSIMDKLLRDSKDEKTTAFVYSGDLTDSPDGGFETFGKWMDKLEHNELPFIIPPRP